MICSTIIPTIGRSTLSRAVSSVLDQDFDRNKHEVIIVNDSGESLPREDWMASEQVKIIHTDRHNRSVARNSGASIARSMYLHFLDDDDWILPGAFRSLWDQAKASQAGWIYGGFHLVNTQGELIKEILPAETGNCFIHMIASEWIPLQASWINSKVFFDVGGFANLHSLDGGYEDIDISRLVARYYDFARLPEPVAVIRFGDIDSTTNYNDLVRQNRRSREKCLDLPGTFSRLHASAKNSAYWQGKIAYYYLASFRWNIKQRRLTKAASRAAYLLLALAVSGPNMRFPFFWRGVWQPHFNLVRLSLGRLMEQAYQNTDWKN